MLVLEADLTQKILPPAPILKTAMVIAVGTSAAAVGTFRADGNRELTAGGFHLALLLTVQLLELLDGH